MKILIVLPAGQPHKLEFGPIKMSFREAPLTATTLAALIPDNLNAQVTIADESVSPIPLQEHYDLVGVSVLTGTSTRAYQIADYFRKKGAKVILGGVHVTLLPEEARQHADAIVIGFAEQAWPQLLKDITRGELKPIYQQEAIDLSRLAVPRRELQKKFGYSVPDTVFATRGCRGKCEFCSVVAADFGWHTRPVRDVIDELKSIKAKRIAFNDVNLTDDPAYAKELFRAMIPLRKTWGGLATTRVAEDDELLELLQKSGCRYLLLGFESVDNQMLRGINKAFNKYEKYAEVVRKLHEIGIIVQGCFIFGMDGEDDGIFERTLEAVNALKIDIPRYALFTPYPGSKSFHRLKAEGRILHEKWEYYDTQHVVIQPENMSPQQLDEGFKWIYKETFKLKHVLTRTIGSGMNFFIGFVGNLAYKLYIRKLYRDTNRFPAPSLPGVEPAIQHGSQPRPTVQPSQTAFRVTHI